MKRLIEAKNLSVDYIQKDRRRLRAVSDVSLTVGARETLAVVGESGCGKSTLGRALLRLVPLTRGEIFFDGNEITRMSMRDFAQTRRRM